MIAVQLIAGNRMTDAGCVRARLVHAPGQQPDADESALCQCQPRGKNTARFQCAFMRRVVFGTVSIGTVSFRFRQWNIDFPVAARPHAHHQSGIVFPDAALFA